MNTNIRDYNNAERLAEEAHSREWEDLKEVFTALPVYLKPSDQAGIKGKPIFDPIATNAFIKSRLQSKGWNSNIPIPERYRFIGTDIDLGKNGVIVEVQFSNYPFLLNNTLRSELFYKAEVEVASGKTSLIVIITKGHMFPASNSTLYYEQAKNQLDALAEHNVFRVPIRLVGLIAPMGENLPAIWTVYREARYSRTIRVQRHIRCDIRRGRSDQSRCTITIRRKPR